MRIAEPVAASWKAELSLGFSRKAQRTILSERAHEGPLVVQKPLYPEGDAVCHAIVVHPPGGIAGGDEVVLSVRTENQAAALLTTPGAGKWYRSAGPWARQKLRFEVGGALEWLPQETIVFDGALADLQSEIRLEPDARYLGWEILCLGRTGSGERFKRGRIQLNNALYRGGRLVRLEPDARYLGWEILCLGRTGSGEQFKRGRIQLNNALYRGERLVWLERGRLEGGGALLESPAGLQGQPVCATLVASGAQFDIAACRSIEGIAVTQLPGVLVARYLGASSEAARRLFIRLWSLLRPSLFGRDAMPPRIWST